jgi:hypothetical protein
MKPICLVAILKDEEPFLDEWLVYHKMIGIDHFFLYDDSPDLPLQQLLQPHAAYVTVIPWFYVHENLPGRNRQTKAYMNAVAEYGAGFEWMTFIDGDEFIELRKHDTINEFLAGFPNADSISLRWHAFGHNGYYNDPPGLITASLIRRKIEPHYNVKSITRSRAIVNIPNAHICELRSNEGWVDANNRAHENDIYDGISDVAHINHYQCRSFTRWLKRAKRGTVSINHMTGPVWLFDEDGCLQMFVMSMTLDKHEIIDTYMQKYTAAILYKLMKMGIKKCNV